MTKEVIIYLIFKPKFNKWYRAFKYPDSELIHFEHGLFNPIEIKNIDSKYIIRIKQ